MPAQVPFVHPLDPDDLDPVLLAQQNNNFEALASNFYSDDGSEPAVRFPFQWRFDRDVDLVKVGNEAADDWHVVGELAGDDASPPVFGLGVYVTKDAEGTAGANLITFSFQVCDLRADAAAVAVPGRRTLRIVLATSSFGAPAGTQTVVVVTGVEIAVLSAGKVLDVETDEDGLAEITVEVSGAGDRFVRATCGHGKAYELSGTWA